MSEKPPAYQRGRPVPGPVHEQRIDRGTQERDTEDHNVPPEDAAAAAIYDELKKLSADAKQASEEAEATLSTFISRHADSLVSEDFDILSSIQTHFNLETLNDAVDVSIRLTKLVIDELAAGNKLLVEDNKKRLRVLSVKLDANKG